MREFLTPTGLIGPVEARHGVPPRTCVRGKHRIDYILISPYLQSAVTRAGHLGIHDAIQSDHCGIWLEFDGRKLFRGSTEHLGSTVEAPFTAREISKMDKYIETMEAHLKETKVEERLEQLITENQPQEDVFIETYEKISRDIDEAMKAGMNKVRRKNVGFARSPELTRAASLVRYWKTQLRATRNKVAMSKATLTFAKKNDLPVTVQSLPEVYLRLRQAWARLRLIQKNAAELRTQWLEELADSAATEANTSKEVALRQIL